jgi:hypothetical protein
MTTPELRKQIRELRLKACPSLVGMKRDSLVRVLAKLEAEVLAQAEVMHASMMPDTSKADAKAAKAAEKAAQKEAAAAAKAGMKDTFAYIKAYQVGKIAKEKADVMAAEKALKDAEKEAAKAQKESKKADKAAAKAQEKADKAAAKAATANKIEHVIDDFGGPPVPKRKLTAAERKARVEANKAAVANVGKKFSFDGVTMGAPVPHGVEVKRYMDKHPGVPLGEASKIVAAARRAQDAFAQ